MKNLQRKEKSEKKEEGYKSLLIWQKSILLNTLIFEVTKTFPYEERLGITSQIRRSAVSIPSNIAEGFGRMSKKSLSAFLKIALGSVYELETQILISKTQGFVRMLRILVI